ncbi:recombinase family protein [Streptomyces hirsutus]|uniref:recombinase family protein n=1 Tax=Streptomyces hirsutus TaxID=35620 RepID=UPI00339E6CE5
MNVHAAVYGRQSSARENKSEVSTADQVANGKAEAERRGAAHIAVYEDLGISAFKADTVRPDFERMLTDCRMGRINMIVVYYVSRFSRMEPLDAIPIITELLNLGVTIVSVTEGEFRKGNIMDLIHLLMRLDAAHQESKNKSVAVRGAKKTARELGGYVGGTAGYGFTLKPETRQTVDGKPVVVQIPHQNTKEAEVIRAVWATIRRHMNEPHKGTAHPGSLSGICIQLNNDGTPTRGQTVGKGRKASRWEPTTLKRILMDPRLAGFDAEPVYGQREDGTPTRTIKGYRIRRDPETMEPIRFAAPIIEPSEWYELQTWLESRGRGRGLARQSSLLSGLRTLDGAALFTCECARPMGSLNSGSANGHRANYRCTRARGGEYPGEHTGGNTIVQEYIDDYVAQRIFAKIRAAEDDPATLLMIAEATRRFGIVNEAAETSQERARLITERADTARALEELYEDRAAGAYSGTIGAKHFRKSQATLNTRLEGIEGRLRELGETTAPILPISAWMPDDPDADPIGPGSWWHGATLEERRAFVELFVQRITVRKATRRGGRTWVESDTAARVSVEFVQPEGADAFQLGA